MSKPAKAPQRRIEHDVLGTSPRKAGINSDRKGRENETRLCKLLEKWTGQRFIRTPSSGGRRLTNNRAFCGDVVCENETFDFIFSVETKHLAAIRVKDELRLTPKVFRIWEQCRADAERADKIPLLLLRENGMPIDRYFCFISHVNLYEFMRLYPESNVHHIVSGVTEGGEIIIACDSQDFMRFPYELIFGFIKNSL